MTTVFLSGPLCHAPLLAAVLGHAPPGRPEPARLPRARLEAVQGGALAIPRAGGEGGGEGIDGLLVHVPGPDALARLDFYQAVFGLVRRPALVLAGADAPRDVPADQYLPANAPAADAAAGGQGRLWDGAGWRHRWAPTVTGAAADIMSRFPGADPVRLGARYPQILTRAGARLRAATAPVAVADGIRRAHGPGDVRVDRLSHPYEAYFAVEERDLAFRRFDGSMSVTVNRATFISGDAVVVLPYDPVRDRVLVIEQFRAGPQARGAANPWLIEAVAGRIDGGEGPREAALREAREEASLSIRTLIEGPAYYPSPAAKAEYIYSFVGLTDLPDGAAGLGGLPAEAEDIRSHVIGFDRLMALVGSAEVANAPLILLAYWLQTRRQALRDAAGA